MRGALERYFHLAAEATLDVGESLRNILVHDYARVDPAELQRHLARLDDFRAFARHVSARLAK